MGRNGVATNAKSFQCRPAMRGHRFEHVVGDLTSSKVQRVKMKWSQTGTKRHVKVQHSVFQHECLEMTATCDSNKITNQRCVGRFVKLLQVERCGRLGQWNLNATESGALEVNLQQVLFRAITWFKTLAEAFRVCSTRISVATGSPRLSFGLLTDRNLRFGMVCKKYSALEHSRKSLEARLRIPGVVAVD